VSVQPEAPGSKPEIKQVISQEEEKIKDELQNIFIDLLTSAQELSYEIATLEPKDAYTKDEIKDLLDAGRRVVANVKKMHQFLKTHTPKR
jgi:cob(I)alamin adenosyltransferase